MLSRTASSAETPGGGSVAAIAGALGLGLVQMAIAVTDQPALDSHRARAEGLVAAIVPAADDDVAVFTALMAAYRLPRADDAATAERAHAIEAASVAATEGPLDLVALLVDALVLAAEVEPLVKRGIVSDVLAGRDLLSGAARAALRTADVNLAALERVGSSAAGRLRARRQALVAAVAEAA